MSNQPEILKTPKIKVVISGEKSAGKSVLAQLIAGHLRLLGHNAMVIERENGERYKVNMPERAREFRDTRDIKIEVKESAEPEPEPLPKPKPARPRKPSAPAVPASATQPPLSPSGSAPAPAAAPLTQSSGQP